MAEAGSEGRVAHQTDVRVERSVPWRITGIFTVPELRVIHFSGQTGTRKWVRFSERRPPSQQWQLQPARLPSPPSVTFLCSLRGRLRGVTILLCTDIKIESRPEGGPQGGGAGETALRGKWFCGFKEEIVHRRRTMDRGEVGPLKNISSLFREKKLRD